MAYNQSPLIFLSQVFASISVFILYVLVPNNVILWSTILTIVFFVSVFSSFVWYTFNHFQYFLIFSFLFLLSLPVLQVINLYEFPIGYKFLEDDGITLSLSSEVVSKALISLCFMLLGSSIGWSLSAKDKFVVKYPRYSPPVKPVLIKIFFYTVWLCTSAFYFRIFLNSLTYGYVESIHLGSGKNYIDVILHFVSFFYILSFSIFIFHSKSNKVFLARMVISTFPYLFLFLAGQRGPLIYSIITLLIFYQYTYRDIKFKYLIFIFIALLLYSSLLTFSRFTIESNLGLLDKIILTVFRQGQSIGVIAYAIDLREEFINKVPFLFGYVDAVFDFTKNYTHDGIASKSYLAQHLTYHLNTEKLLRGSTIGTSMVAEALLLFQGVSFLLLPFYAAIMFLANVMIKRVCYNPLYFFLGFNFFYYLVFSARGSLFKIFNKEFVFVIFVIFLLMILHSSYKHFNRQSSEKNTDNVH